MISEIETTTDPVLSREDAIAILNTPVEELDQLIAQAENQEISSCSASFIRWSTFNVIVILFISFFLILNRSFSFILPLYRTAQDLLHFPLRKSYVPHVLQTPGSQAENYLPDGSPHGRHSS